MWPPEAKTKLVELWALGLSASMIADELNIKFDMQLTRNAVIGQSHRLKLPPHRVLEKKEKPPRQLLLIQRHKTVAVIVPPQIKRRVLSVFELNKDGCRWPLNDGAPWQFCGAPLAKGSYCSKHGELAWVKKSK